MAFHVYMQSDTPDSGDQIHGEHLHANNMGAVPTENPTKWWTYLLEIAGTTKQQDIAVRAGVDQSHLSRWKNGYPPSVPFVIKVAEAYGRNVLEALVAAEIITPEQADLHEVRVTSLDEYSTRELLEEVLRRESRGSELPRDDLE